MSENIITQLEKRIAAECSPVDREAAFDEMLDECYSFDSVGGPFAHMCPSSVLKECDPVAYRCGVNDYADGQDWFEVGGENYRQEDCEGIRAEMVDELESELADLEKNEDGEDSAELDELRDTLDELKKHTF